MAATDAGATFVAYGKEDTVYVSVSKDFGASFGAPIKVGSPGKLSLGMRRGPRIAVSGKTLCISAVYGENGRGRDGDLVAFTSRDQGQSWSGPKTVNDVPGSAREGLHAMAASPDGTLACAWLDLRSKGTRLYYSISRDGGDTWSANRLAYASPGGSICECCHPSLAFDAQGGLWSMFRNSLDGARDMYLTHSSNLIDFGPAAKLGDGSWSLPACPMDGGMLAFGPRGEVGTVWRRANRVFRAAKEEPEAPMGPGKQPWMARAAEGFVYVWQEGPRIVLSGPGTRSRTLSESGNDPVVAASPNGKFTVCAWTESGVRAFVTRDGLK